MGYNTTVIVMNDALSSIEKDKNFGKELAKAISHASLGAYAEKHKLDVHAGSFCNAATVIESHHADNTSIVAVGGNYGTKIIESYGWDHYEHETQVRLLKVMAEKLGYNISKK